ncbi:hypothetical protein J7F03_27660 [Streptomyces sp. ISL-43]|uniref:hypothetical protein n=1 Tax=Streptomyces sp. ISL-43 TaxID=2819183 RepID=UPI001BE5DDE4|nr:hypothetical protein [Streptomyces sp. ISL-43]MBT2450782.1 hypothetical protein [Streptomyces sp. ISL-43]
MTTPIDELLDDARLPTPARSHFDVGAALRRLARDAAKAQAPAQDIERAAEAAQSLIVVSRWLLNQPNAAHHVDRLANSAKDLDIEGAAVFACLLHLTGHPESAQFWWQLAAGAGHRAAAYCLHLHHRALGESREAKHWRRQVMQAPIAPWDLTDTFLDGICTFARYVGANGSEATGPTGVLEMEVDRLAEDGEDACIIVPRPDRRLADHLLDFARR